MNNLEVLIESGKRLIVVKTRNEADVMRTIKDIARHSRRVYSSWTATKGLSQIPVEFDRKPLSTRLEVLFSEIAAAKRDSVFVLIDFHPYIDDPMNIRRVKDVLISNPGIAIILLSQDIEVPEELEVFSTEYASELPTRDEIDKLVRNIAKQWYQETRTKVKSENQTVIARLIDNLSGIPIDDVERLARNAIFDDGIICKQDILNVSRDKFALLNQDSVLHLHLDYDAMNKVAGMPNLKRWLELRGPIFTGEVDLPGEDSPKGMLLLGVQGCGKSLAAKATAGAWHIPLLHLDMGALYNRFFGQTEQNLRDALDTAEAMSPCILWIDEIEKGLSAVSGSDDVSKRMLGSFLTWLAEKKARVFVVATANDISALPPELMRKGRFDEIFFVDLPTKDDRQKILEIHMEKRKISLDQVQVSAIADQTEGFSGAELEQLVVSALYASYGRQSGVTVDLLKQEIEQTQPLSITMKEDVDSLRDWAVSRTAKA